jgi:hypothetical protein
LSKGAAVKQRRENLARKRGAALDAIGTISNAMMLAEGDFHKLSDQDMDMLIEVAGRVEKLSRLNQGYVINAPRQGC